MNLLSPVTYSENLPNSGRQFAIDLAKFFCIFIMISGHCYERFIKMEIYTEPVPFFSAEGVYQTFATAAVLFMICLGVGLVYSHRTTVKHMLNRSKSMVIMALLLAFFTNTLSLLIISGITNNPESLYPAAGWLFCCDILNFACLVFLFFALVRKLHLSNLVVFLIAVALLVISMFVPSNLFSDNIILQDLTGWFFWQDNGFSFFPFAQWIIFPVCGYLFGQLLIQTKNTRKFYRNVTIISGAGLVLYTAILMLSGFDLSRISGLCTGMYYDVTIVTALWLLLFMFFLLSILYWISLLIKPKSWLYRFITSTSSLLTPIYVLQWLIIGFLYYWVFIPMGIIPVNLPTIIISTILIFAASYFIAKVQHVVIEKLKINF